MIVTGILGVVVGVNLVADAILRQRVGQRWRGRLSSGAALTAGGFALLVWGIVV